MWKLTSYAREKSNIASIPQCLNAVKCTYMREPSPSERTACNSKSGEINAVNDEKGCIKEYKCFTKEQLVEQAISRVQRPGCQINQDAKNKMMKCYKNGQFNFDNNKYDNNGCLLDVTCIVN
jgi:hypothetical protein